MAALGPLRDVQQRSTGRWYDNRITPKPDAIGDAEFVRTLVPVVFVMGWPWLLALGSLVGIAPFGSISIVMASGLAFLFPSFAREDQKRRTTQPS